MCRTRQGAQNKVEELAQEVHDLRQGMKDMEALLLKGQPRPASLSPSPGREARSRSTSPGRERKKLPERPGERPKGGRPKTAG